MWDASKWWNGGRYETDVSPSKHLIAVLYTTETVSLFLEKGSVDQTQEGYQAALKHLQYYEW